MNIEQIFDQQIKPDQYAEWLDQFDEPDRAVIEHLVERFRYYSVSRVSEAMRRLYAAIVAQAGVDPERLRFIPVGYVAKSGSAIAYYFRKQNKLKEDAFLTSADVGAFDEDDSLVPVLIDDFIGSGHQSIQVVDELRAAAPTYTGKIIFAVVVALERGLEVLRADLNVHPIAADTVSDSELPFSEVSEIFPSEAERDRAKQVLAKYGARLYPKYPLGYADGQCLIGFFYSTPNNTLPIFWSTDDGWIPLLSHGESFRDPSYLFGPPTGLSSRIFAAGANKILAQMNHIEELDGVPEDLTATILREFHKPSFLFTVAPIVIKLGFNAHSLSALVGTLTRLRSLKHEQQPVRSGLLVSPSSVEVSSFGRFIAEAGAEVSLSNGTEIEHLVQLVDGFGGGLAVNGSGRVTGVVLYKTETTLADTLLPRRYAPAAAASKNCAGLVFVCDGNGRMQAFFGGQKVLSYRNSSWHHYHSNLKTGLTALTRKYGLRGGVLTNVMKLVLRMSDAGKGALITVGDNESVLRHSDPQQNSHLRLKPMQVGAVPDEMLMGLMAQDGATVISAEGHILQGMTFLRPPAGTQASEEVGRGSKHSTAAKITKVTAAVAIALSVDGRITIYGDGEVQFKFMG